MAVYFAMGGAEIVLASFDTATSSRTSASDGGSGGAQEKQEKEKQEREEADSHVLRLCPTQVFRRGGLRAVTPLPNARLLLQCQDGTLLVLASTPAAMTATTTTAANAATARISPGGGSSSNSNGGSGARQGVLGSLACISCWTLRCVTTETLSSAGQLTLLHADLLRHYVPNTPPLPNHHHVPAAASTTTTSISSSSSTAIYAAGSESEPSLYSTVARAAGDGLDVLGFERTNHPFSSLATRNDGGSQSVADLRDGGEVMHTVSVMHAASSSIVNCVASVGTTTGGSLINVAHKAVLVEVVDVVRQHIRSSPPPPPPLPSYCFLGSFSRAVFVPRSLPFCFVCVKHCAFLPVL